MALRRADLNQISRAVKYISKDKRAEINQKPYMDADKIAHRINQKQKRLSDAEIVELVKGYESGLTVYQLSEEFGCHRETVSAQLKANGIKKQRRPLSEEQIDEVIRLYQSGLSCLKVGELFKVNATTIHGYLIRRGIPRRSPNEKAVIKIS